MIVPCEKMILAVLSGDDVESLVYDLNEHGLYATMLSSTGGFLKKRSVTLMIGLEEKRLEEALEILKKHAGARLETAYLSPNGAVGMAAAPVKVYNGGITAFVMNVDRCVKY